ncbi:MAG TPA: efflux transporter outer membrane subunit [Steroidobacteraceae bacterium]|jgi:NodT family efflux transporter outer membrane factor (OMF) lipoprotein|nr:efflux transporter outer membrane subunit [Steroidobacteraceae bacterium]
MRLFILGVTVTVLTACAVGPNFKRPQSPASDRYTATDLPSSFASGANVPYAWWKVYRCPPLDALVESALQGSPTVQAAQAALRQANELLKAQRAVLFPTLLASYSPTRERNAVGTLAPTLSSAQPLFTLQTAQVSVSYMLDVFGGNRRQIESAQAQADTQRFDLEAAYLTLTSNIVAAAIQEASLRAQIEANEAIVRSERDGLDILNKQLSLGSIAQTAVMAQQAALAAAEAQLPPLRKQLAIQRDLLAVLAGRSPGEPPSQTFELSALTLPTDLPVSLPSALVRQRPDVLSAEEQLHYASAQVGVAIADMLPQINLLATYGGASTGLSTLLASGNTFWSAGASLSQTLFAGGALWHHKLAADAALDEAGAEYRTVVLTALQNVADTLNALQFDDEAVAADERADQAARASLVASRASLTQGSITYLDLLNAEQAQSLAISNLEQARGSRLADTAALFVALGGGWWNRSDPAPQR